MTDTNVKVILAFMIIGAITTCTMALQASIRRDWPETVIHSFFTLVIMACVVGTIFVISEP